MLIWNLKFEIWILKFSIFKFLNLYFFFGEKTKCFYVFHSFQENISKITIFCFSLPHIRRYPQYKKLYFILLNIWWIVKCFLRFVFYSSFCATMFKKLLYLVTDIYVHVKNIRIEKNRIEIFEMSFVHVKLVTSYCYGL